jgi:hypothetical protein
MIGEAIHSLKEAVSDFLGVAHLRPTRYLE